MKKLIILILCLYGVSPQVHAQVVKPIGTLHSISSYVQPYYATNTIRFYTVASIPSLVILAGQGPPVNKTLDLNADIQAAWGTTGGAINAVVVYNSKIFVSIATGAGTGGVLIYNLSNATHPIVIKPQFPTKGGLQSIGIAINPKNGDLYIPTVNNGNGDSGVYVYTAGSNYATGSQFASYYNDKSVGQVCANLAFDNNGNLWMTTWTPANTAAAFAPNNFVICYKGLSKNNYYKIKNTPTPAYKATDVNNHTTGNLYLLSAPEGIAADASGNIWVGNNNDSPLANGAGQGTLVKFSSSWVASLLTKPSTGESSGNPVYTAPTPPTTDVTIYYIPNGKLGGLTFAPGSNLLYINDQGQNQGSTWNSSGTVWFWNTQQPFNSTYFTASGIHTTYPGNGTGSYYTVSSLTPTP